MTAILVLESEIAPRDCVKKVRLNANCHETGFETQLGSSEASKSVSCNEGIG